MVETGASWGGTWARQYAPRLSGCPRSQAVPLAAPSCPLLSLPSSLTSMRNSPPPFTFPAFLLLGLRIPAAGEPLSSPRRAYNPATGPPTSCLGLKRISAATPRPSPTHCQSWFRSPLDLANTWTAEGGGRFISGTEKALTGQGTEVCKGVKTATRSEAPSS